MTPLTVRQPLRFHAARLGRCIDAHRTMPSVILHLCASVPPDPTALERFDQAEPFTAASVWSFSRRTGKE